MAPHEPDPPDELDQDDHGDQRHELGGEPPAVGDQPVGGVGRGQSGHQQDVGQVQHPGGDDAQTQGGRPAADGVRQVQVPNGS